MSHSCDKQICISAKLFGLATHYIAKTTLFLITISAETIKNKIKTTFCSWFRPFLPVVFLFSRGQPRENFNPRYGPIPQVKSKKLQIFSRYGKCATTGIPRVKLEYTRGRGPKNCLRLLTLELRITKRLWSWFSQHKPGANLGVWDSSTDPLVLQLSFHKIIFSVNTRIEAKIED